MTLQNCYRTSPIKKNYSYVDDEGKFHAANTAQEENEFEKFDRYMTEGMKGTRANLRKDTANILGKTIGQMMRGKIQGSENMTLFSTPNGDIVASWNDPQTPGQRSFSIVDVDDDNNVSLIPAFSLAEDSFASPLASLNKDWVDKKTLGSFSPKYGALDPKVFAGVRRMYDESGGTYTPRSVYASALEAPIWDFTNIIQVPGRENAPRIGRMPSTTRTRRDAWVVKGKEPIEAPEMEEEAEVPLEKFNESTTGMFAKMRAVRMKKNDVVTDDGGNVDIVKSSTHSLFKSRMKGSR